MEYEHIAAEEVAPISGFYDPADDTIYMARHMGKCVAEITYYHERQHRLCFLTGCFCYDMTSNYWAERHAYKRELEDVIARNSRSITTAYFRCTAYALKKFEEQPKVWQDNSRALKHVVGTKLYREFSDECGI